MRIILAASLALFTVLAVATAAYACPQGYAACGPHYCCPR